MWVSLRRYLKRVPPNIKSEFFKEYFLFLHLFFGNLFLELHPLQRHLLHIPGIFNDWKDTLQLIVSRADTCLHTGLFVIMKTLISLIITIKESAFTMAVHITRKGENLTTVWCVLSKERFEHLVKSSIPYSSAKYLRYEFIFSQSGNRL